MDTSLLLSQLAIQRQRAAAAKAAKEKLLEAVYASPEYQAALSESADANEQMAILETAIHQDGLTAYIQSGDKKPFDGVTVKVFTRLKYDLVTALDWSRKNRPELLTLDTRLFEQYAKGVAGSVPVPCVEMVTEPRVQIAADLSKFILQGEPKNV